MVVHGVRGRRDVDVVAEEAGREPDPRPGSDRSRGRRARRAETGARVAELFRAEEPVREQVLAERKEEVQALALAGPAGRHRIDSSARRGAAGTRGARATTRPPTGRDPRAGYRHSSRALAKPAPGRRTSSGRFSSLGLCAEPDQVGVAGHARDDLHQLAYVPRPDPMWYIASQALLVCAKRR